MYKVKKILFPLDYSNVSREALSMALQLANYHGAELYMLHVEADLDKELQRRIVTAPNDNVIEQSIATEEHGLNDALEKEIARAAASGVVLKRPKTTLMVTGGDTLEVLLQTVKEEQIDVIVTGTHGPKGVIARLKGSVSEQLVRQATCSVFVLKPAGYPYLRD